MRVGGIILCEYADNTGLTPDDSVTFLGVCLDVSVERLEGTKCAKILPLRVMS